MVSAWSWFCKSIWDAYGLSKSAVSSESTSESASSLLEEHEEERKSSGLLLSAFLANLSEIFSAEPALPRVGLHLLRCEPLPPPTFFFDCGGGGGVGVDTACDERSES